MKILALDCSSDLCSLALTIDKKIYTKQEKGSRLHAKKILSMLERLLSENNIKFNDLDALALGIGPGSFTGLRVGASIMQGLHAAFNKPVILISTLKALANKLEIDTEANILSIIDARKGEVYWNLYDSKIKELQQESLCLPKDLKISNEIKETNLVAVGTGALLYKDIFMEKFTKIKIIEDILYPTADSIAKLAIIEFESGKFFQKPIVPVYIRNNVTQ